MASYQASVVLCNETQLMRQELNEETLGLAISAVAAIGFLIMATGAHFYALDQGLTLGPLLIGVAGLAQVLRRRRQGAAGWALVLGCLAAVAIAAHWLGAGVLTFLFIVPVGLAAILNGLASGLLTATACTLFLWLLPPGAPAAVAAPQAVATACLWATLGLVGLTTRTWLTSLQWAWSTYEQNRRLLEGSRDSQMQLKQALADLTEANTHLARLHSLAQDLRQVAEDARRAKEEFVANVSHELRTPLNMIVGFAQMIVEQPATHANPHPPPRRAHLGGQQRNAPHHSEQIDDGRDNSQVEAGRMALVKERVAISSLVEDALVAVRPLYDTKKLYLRTEVAEDLPLVLCDPTRIREVLLNLLSNAGRFTEQGGVCLRVRRDGDDLVVSVADTGPGIASAQRDRLFRPFQQLDGSTGRRHGGTGLGLAISRSFVELHGGRMWLESDEGTAATI